MIAFSIVIPVYRNEGNIPSLLERLASLRAEVPEPAEVVFVIDGSPDRSEEMLLASLASQSFPSQLITLSRNFGSFSAIRAGLEAARGEAYGVIAADLQEPPELLPAFARELLADTCDVCVGTRALRHDTASSRRASTLFWWLYRRLVQPQMPAGGLDVFGCNRKVRDVLLSLTEANSSLVGELIWMGFRRKEIAYDRQERLVGKSAWTFRRKWKYMADSIFSFTDLPIRLLTAIGLAGAAVVLAAGIVILAFWACGAVPVPGYAPIMLAILFVGFTNLLGLGVVGNYVWRGYENSKHRPLHIVRDRRTFPREDTER